MSGQESNREACSGNDQKETPGLEDAWIHASPVCLESVDEFEKYLQLLPDALDREYIKQYIQHLKTE